MPWQEARHQRALQWQHQNCFSCTFMIFKNSPSTEQKQNRSNSGTLRHVLSCFRAVAPPDYPSDRTSEQGIWEPKLWLFPVGKAEPSEKGKRPSFPASSAMSEPAWISPSSPLLLSHLSFLPNSVSPRSLGALECAFLKGCNARWCACSGLVQVAL